MDLVEILKNVPKGTKMYSPLFKEPVTFERIERNCRFPIVCKTSASECINFTAKGCFSFETATQNCMLFPTQDRTWDGYEYIPEGSLVICKRDNKITQIACSKGVWCYNNCLRPSWWYDFNDGKLRDNTGCLFWYDAVPTLQEMATIDKLLAEKGYLFVNQRLEKIKSFKKGDIIVDNTGIIAIFDSIKEDNAIVYQAIRRTSGQVVVKTDVGIGYARNARLASQEEKDLFFVSLTKEGYSWDGEKVVPVFKKGDIVVSGGGCIAIVDHVGDFSSFNNVIHYQCCLDPYGDLIIKTDVGIGHACDCKYASIHDQERILRKLDEQGFVLKDDIIVKKKYDPKTFEPYQKVLVRSSSKGKWRCTFFSHMTDDRAICSGDNWPQCIPYANNGHLRGKTDDCSDFYKWWENN